mmetsp:Transcript_22901/g.56919  ORF Transcript_22901/g.56919 Transcript_22901/m.56919 type:complete len:163 (+) Transcript_22901:155-643(+)
MIQVGDKLPAGSLQLIKDSKLSSLSIADVFNGKQVAICGVPGAFTPTCSDTHLPGFIALAPALKSAGFDAVICVAVNDCFVMDAWGASVGAAAGDVAMLSDGGAAWTKALGLEKDTGDFGGVRMRRVAMAVEDGVVKVLNVEAGAGVSDSAAEKLLEDWKKL